MAEEKFSVYWVASVCWDGPLFAAMECWIRLGSVPELPVLCHAALQVWHCPSGVWSPVPRCPVLSHLCPAHSLGHVEQAEGSMEKVKQLSGKKHFLSLFEY